MCLEDTYYKADPSMKEWARWFKSGSIAKELGYPSCSPEQKLPGSNGKLIEPTNIEAEKIEKLLTELNILWAECYQALTAYYLLDLSMSAIAHRNGISKPTFQRYFERGMGFIERGLRIN